MARGGARPGAGRKLGSMNRLSNRAREQAMTTGDLPHEFLLRVARGEEIDGHIPTFAERIDAAKAAAQYFAPRLTAAHVDAAIRPKSVRELSDAFLEHVAAGADPAAYGTP